MRTYKSLKRLAVCFVDCMKIGCKNSNCKSYGSKSNIVKEGSYFRKSDSRRIQRFRCKRCLKKFSAATGTLEANQNKRRINKSIEGLLCSSVSMRRIAILLNINRKTVKRKLIYLAKKAELVQEEYLESLESSPVFGVQIDDLITIEHSKLKPLTVSIAVNSNNRKILGAEVRQIAAFGLLAEKSVRKYGKRKSEHFDGLETLFSKIHKAIDKDAIIESDDHKMYPYFIKKYCPTVIHHRLKSEKSSVVAGQGELKKTKHDPIFCINHTLAMFRANINRLVRRTWCTTKDLNMLQKHIQIYIGFHNNRLT